MEEKGEEFKKKISTSKKDTGLIHYCEDNFQSCIEYQVTHVVSSKVITRCATIEETHP